MADEGGEHTLCTIKRVFAFRIPPRSSSQGHRAGDWDKTPVWKGRMRIIEKNDKASILLEHEDKPGLFAACPVHSDPNKPPSFEGVLDSSRYFVLRLEDGKGNYAYIGIGFNTRDEAFEFKVSLRDFTKSVNDEIVAKEEAKTAPKMDFSLKEPIRLGGNIDNRKAKKAVAVEEPEEEDEDDEESTKKKKKKGKKKSKQTEQDDSGDPFSLAPPPAPTKGRTRRKKQEAEEEDPQEQEAQEEEEEEEQVAPKAKKAPAKKAAGDSLADDILGLGLGSVAPAQPKPKKQDDWSLFDA
jgi:hypothetical protein